MPDTKEPKIFIIIVNYNNHNDTVECLQSLSDIQYKNYEIVVVDNASMNIKQLKDNKIIKNCKLILNSQNLGFAGGNNVGIKYAIKNSADYILLLNNDTTVEKDFLTHLVESAESNSQWGIITGKILYYSNKKIWFAGGRLNLIKGSAVHRGVNKPQNKYNKIQTTTFASGCLQLIRTEVFHIVGLLDQDYFLYYEDVDFCYRVLQQGYKICYQPNSIIYHKAHATTIKFSNLQLYYWNRNKLMFWKKNIKNPLYKIIFLIIFIFTRLLLVFRFWSKRKYIFLGIKDFFVRNYGKGRTIT